MQNKIFFKVIRFKSNILCSFLVTIGVVSIRSTQFQSNVGIVLLTSKTIKDGVLVKNMVIDILTSRNNRIIKIIFGNNVSLNLFLHSRQYFKKVLNSHSCTFFFDKIIQRRANIWGSMPITSSIGH